MAPVEQKTTDFLAENNRFEPMLEFRKSQQSQRRFGTKNLCSIWMSTCFISSVSIVLRKKLLSHDLNAFCCVRLPSRDAKPMLNVIIFPKMAVQYA